MATSQQRRAVGVFATRHEAENALVELKNSGFPMGRVSVIAQNADRPDEIAGVDTSDRITDEADEGAAAGAVTGTALGGAVGLLAGLGFLAIPGLGPLFAAGTIGTTLATTAAGAGIGAASGSLVGALAGLGIAEDRAKVYDRRVSQGGYLVIVDGTAEEIHVAESILNHRGIQEWGVYDSPTY